MAVQPSSHLVMFTGTECVKCHEMYPMIDQLEKELGVKVEKLEVWHNAENADYMQKVSNGRCMSLPMFHNSKTDAIICGKTEDYEEVKKWAQ